MHADAMRWRGCHVRVGLSCAVAGLALVGCGADSVGNQLVQFPGQVLGSPSPGIRTPALKDGRTPARMCPIRTVTSRLR